MQISVAMFYALCGVIVACLALHASRGLTIQLVALFAAGQRLGREVPRATAAYFRHTAGALALSATAFLVGAATDALLARVAPSDFASGFLGYGSAIFLLFASCILILQARRDRKLGLHKPAWRLAYVAGGAAGVVVSVAGKLSILEYGSIWP